MRLGLEAINADYAPALTAILGLPQCVGLLGGLLDSRGLLGDGGRRRAGEEPVDVKGRGAVPEGHWRDLPVDHVARDSVPPDWALWNHE